MSTEHDMGPTRETFDFAAYVAGKSTFPTFDHTVYLDQHNGVALARAAEEYTKLAERIQEIGRIRAAMAEQAYTPLVSQEAEELADELGEAEERIGELEQRIESLKKTVRESGLTLHLRVGTPQGLGKIVRTAEKQYHEKFGRKADDDPEYLSGKGIYVLAAQLAAYCTGIELPDGREQAAPDREGFLQLLDALISPESARLMQALNDALDSSATWADQIDAGFPGGGADVGGEPVGGLGAEGGPGVVSGPAAGAQWGGRGVDGGAEQGAGGGADASGGGDV
jgi:hypothetical protein